MPVDPARGEDSRAPAGVLPANEFRPLGVPTSTNSARPSEPGEAESATSGSSPGTGLSASAFRTAGSLALVVGLIFTAARVFKRLSGGKAHGGLAAALGTGGPSPAGLIEVLGRYPVGRGATLILLRLDSRVLLLSQSGGGGFPGLRARSAPASLTTLCEITRPEDVASILVRTQDDEQRTIAAGFKELLTRFDRDAGASDGVELVDVRKGVFGRERKAVVLPVAPDIAELLDERADAAVFAEPDSRRTGASRLRERLAAMRSAAATSGGRAT